MTTTPAVHDMGAAPTPTPKVPRAVCGRRPSGAERARTLAAGATTGALATTDVDHGGHPFASVAPFGLDDIGRPVLCLSALAEHTRNLDADARASLLIGESVAPGGDPLAAGRVTLVGHAAPVTGEEVEPARAVHLAANPQAATSIDYGDFRVWRLDVVHVRWVGGYGHMAWIDAGEWATATPDPLAPHAEAVLAHLNDDHAKACLTLARTLGERPDAFVATAVGVDRYGLELAVSGPGGPGGPGRLRLGFDAPVATNEEARSALVTLVGAARTSVSAGGEP